mmetsp:Transcript_17288/g.42352  ORF Transcript_17288/g.42352 Transcript_17288/m.42352 type:complete len:500 (-) Transcript_17288:424-1923(-)
MSMSTCFWASSQGGAGALGVGFDNRVCITGATITSSTGEAIASNAGLSTLSTVTDVMWVLVAAILVFWMQAGFAMLEAGSVRAKNTNNILFKNLMDASLAAITFWLLGYSFAFGTGKYEYQDTNDNRFIGSGNWALQNFNDDTSYHSWFFQWAFAGAAATIVSGCVAERCRLEAYFVYTILLTTFIYPIVVHWVWSGTGWMSAFYINSDGERYLSKNGVIDFAGSGVVHMTGGFAGLMGAIAIGPRKYFNDPENEHKLKGHSDLLAALGVIILWMGWYGFNAGSTLGAGAGGGTYINVAAKVCVTTTISAAMGAITTMLYSRFVQGYFNLTLCLNGVLAGLVSITAPCSVVEPWAAMMIGIIGSFVYIGASIGIKKAGIDDPLDAFPIHGMCGVWGVLSVGIFATRSNIKRTYGFDNDAMTSGNQFRNQLICVLAISTWVSATSAGIFFPLKFAGLLRVSEEEEEEGLDASEHGVRKPVGEIEGKNVKSSQMGGSTTNV